MIAFQYSTHSKGNNQKSIWWRTAGSNSAVANKVTVRRAEGSLFRFVFGLIAFIRPLDRRVVHVIFVVFVLLYQLNIIPHQGKRWK